VSDDPPTDDVDPEDPRPSGHYPRFRSNTWHYVPDHLARTISLGPGGDGEAGQDWVLSYTPERRHEEDREKVFVRLTPRALQELYIETKDLSREARQAGHGAECDLCGESVDLDGRFRINARTRFTNAVTSMPTAARRGWKTTNNVRRRHRTRHTE
jgi:hypothetical protein